MDVSNNPMKRIPLYRFLCALTALGIGLASCAPSPMQTSEVSKTSEVLPTQFPETTATVAPTATFTPEPTPTPEVHSVRVEDYFGLGPATITELQKTDDKTAELMAQPENLPAASLSSEMISSAGGVTTETVGFNSVVVSQVTLSDVDLGNDGIVDGKQIDMTIVYKYQGVVHSAHVLARGIFATFNLDPVETYFSRLQPGTRINLDLGILTAGTKEDAAKQFKSVWQNDSKWLLIHLAKSGFGKQNMSFSELQLRVASGTLDVDSEIISFDYVKPIQ